MTAQRYAQIVRTTLAQDERFRHAAGDPLFAATRVALIDVFDAPTLEHYAKLWQCPRAKMVELVMGAASG
jgi:hypothetical protein